MRNINVCPGTLEPGFGGYSPSCLRQLFDGKKVNHVLDFTYNAEDTEFIASLNKISISGVQEKLSAILSKGKIRQTQPGEGGRYIIKPAPANKYLRDRAQITANEHLTMQIARQVYKIKTAENALIFFADGEPAYITKRFDYTANGARIPQEDFASLAGKTGETHGTNFKYTGSYEDAAALIRQNVAAWQVEMSDFFALVVFNYIFSNGDAHLKNFSLQQTAAGDYLLAPAYDLMNTSIHINDGDFALEGGLIPTNIHSDIYEKTGHPCKDDFMVFGQRIGVLPKIMNSIIDMFAKEQPMVYELIEHSFLNDKAKRMYKRAYIERLHRFQRSGE